MKNKHLVIAFVLAMLVSVGGVYLYKSSDTMESHKLELIMEDQTQMLNKISVIDAKQTRVLNIIETTRHEIEE